MRPLTVVLPWTGEAHELQTLASLRSCGWVGETLLVVTGDIEPPEGLQVTVRAERLWSSSAILRILRMLEALEGKAAPYVLWILPGSPILSPEGLERLMGCARDTGAAIVYGDYLDLLADGTRRHHPLVDYQPGSLRDDFDFGAVILLARRKLESLVGQIEGDGGELRSAGWYDLRLRLVERGAVVHLPEPVYEMRPPDERASGQRVFDYVAAGKRELQAEMETVATGHLRRTGALLGPPEASLVEDQSDYPVEASVVIPVKNRARTIADAAQSALSQKTSFDFNVIVVDNHSTDETTCIVAEMAAGDRRLIHLIPKRRDLEIGGCWNEAIYSEHCGRFAVQLDSDDLYAGTDVVERMVQELRRGPYALVIGSYTTVDFHLQARPPGLVDHREWTEANGHNNALRVAGLGAPRAFHVPTLRTIGFPNVSYGEDYAVTLRLCRTYAVGRIYESLYWCRRWEGNSDSALSLEVSNRYAFYKDRLRSIELAARRRLREGPR